jgi:hypothetical protein
MNQLSALVQRMRQMVMDAPGYQKNPLPLSLFQLKDEPEGEGNRAVEEGSFWFEIG